MCSFKQDVDFPSLLMKSSRSILNFSHPSAVTVGDWVTCPVQLANTIPWLGLSELPCSQCSLSQAAEMSPRLQGGVGTLWPLDVPSVTKHQPLLATGEVPMPPPPKCPDSSWEQCRLACFQSLFILQSEILQI